MKLKILLDNEFLLFYMRLMAFIVTTGYMVVIASMEYIDLLYVYGSHSKSTYIYKARIPA